jgi:3-oxoacyl-[acyl-carrier-protein] synthase-3
MTVCLREKLTAGPATVLMSGFGIGLSWGSCIVRTEGIVMPELVEV